MRKISVLTLVAVAAGLSLTACSSDADANGGSAPASSAAADSQGGSSAGSAAGSAEAAGNASDSASSSGSRSGSGAGAASGSAASSRSGSSHSGTAGNACRTANLSFTTSGGMAEGELIVNLKNTGSGPCTMHGFPSVDLKGRDGTVSADRSKLAAPDVHLAPGQETRFTLHYPPNHTGGSGVTFTSLIVTPPNETHSHTLPQSINLPADDNSGPGITVDPIGTGK
ncbi:DUF4232 domain-containing protein [Streptomyces sulfonofaciens]|nr:DUF4232 domain-containing protein [Streptomyces sulfonofaciens]